MTTKIETPVSFTEFQNFLVYNEDPDVLPVVWEKPLLAVLCHTGSVQRGHFISFVKTHGTWRRYDDERVTLSSWSAVKKHTKSVYLLFFGIGERSRSPSTEQTLVDPTTQDDAFTPPSLLFSSRSSDFFGSSKTSPDIQPFLSSLKDPSRSSAGFILDIDHIEKYRVQRLSPEEDKVVGLAIVNMMTKVLSDKSAVQVFTDILQRRSASVPPFQETEILANAGVKMILNEDDDTFPVSLFH
jgi:hypothetical protein